jgi:ferrochelatase
MIPGGNRQGLLLINLGTPDAPTTPAVRRYLREFLSDPRVIDIDPFARWLLLNFVILVFRPRKSAEAYRKIWDERGSPLLLHSLEFTRQIALELEGEFQVEFGMRYGHPSLKDALDRLRAMKVQSITLMPLYPQYAAASTASSLERAYRLIGQGWDVPPIRVVPPFFNQPSFLDALATSSAAVIRQSRADHVLFSFHGLPERQIRKSDLIGNHCLASPQCCDQIGAANTNCYRAQAHYTAREVAKRLGIAAEGFSISFQSRLGRTPWIRPYTDLLVPELARRGVRRLAVLCPAFVADCLETLEEIGIRARASFLAAGGEELVLVPCLNAHPAWVRAAADLVRTKAVGLSNQDSFGRAIGSVSSGAKA